MAFFSLNILLLLVLTAKELLVFNAETLVLLMFILFLITITNQLKTDTKLFFAAQNENLKKEYYSQRTNCITALKHIKRTYTTEISLAQFVAEYIMFFQKILWITNAYSIKKITTLTTRHIEEQLKKIKFEEDMLQQNLQKTIANTLPNQIRTYFKFKSEDEKDLILDTQITNLEAEFE